ncbi:TRAP transporter permease [Kiloniella sp.]|uniref:TRAP transporter permease n=1 Tax=Kiloniella sp. TaxID=1938587 RepID=UPI003B02056B
MTDVQSDRLGQILNKAFLLLGVAMVGYHLASIYLFRMGSLEHQNIHLALVFSLTFLGFASKRNTLWPRLVQLLLLVVGLGLTAYVAINLEHLEEVVGFPEPLDVMIGVALIVVSIEGTRLAWGWTLPIVAMVFVAYFFFGHLLPGPLHHQEFSFDYVISYLSIGLSGVYGTFLGISANQIFLFVVFGSIMNILRINDFLYELGKVAGRRLEGGPGQTAVVSSSLIGMLTGATVANVAITGAFTIPYMKRAGYSPALAGAIEATASTGGQLMPPVMGAAAFLMAFFVGVPYADIMLAGLLPAILFYVAVIIGVQFVSVAEGIKAPKEKPDYGIILRGLPLFLIPVGVITALLLMRYGPSKAAFWGIATALILSPLRAGGRPSWSEVWKTISDGAVVGAQIGISLCVVGLISQTLITTGLGAKIAGLVEMLSAGSMVIGLILTMFVALILGCGVPPVAAYSLVAIVAVPTLIKLGVPPMAAHFFCFYYAIVSAVTPPVALGALAAAGISGANYFSTSIKAFKLSTAGFIIPFLIVFNPVLTLRSETWFDAATSLIAIVIAIISLTAALYGVVLSKLTITERLMAFTSAAALLGYCMMRQVLPVNLNTGLFIIGLSVFGWLVVNQWRKRQVVAEKVVMI